MLRMRSLVHSSAKETDCYNYVMRQKKIEEKKRSVSTL
jgi:hypothetical protein